MLSSHPPEWIPVVPEPGRYPHGEYGEANFSTEAQEQMLRNFPRFDQDLPFRDRHGSSVKWAFIRELRRHDGHLEARLDWTPLGIRAWRDGQIRHISPEVAPVVELPEGQRLENVLVGLAGADVPFFKRRHLPAVTDLAEEGVFAGDYPEGVFLGPTLVKVFETKDAPQQEPLTMAETTTLPDEERQELERLRALEKERQTQTKEYEARIQILERQAQVQAFAADLAEVGDERRRLTRASVQAFAELAVKYPGVGLDDLKAAIGKLDFAPVGQQSFAAQASGERTEVVADDAPPREDLMQKFEDLLAEHKGDIDRASRAFCREYGDEALSAIWFEPVGHGG